MTRRSLAKYLVNELSDSKVNRKKLIKTVAAYLITTKQTDHLASLMNDVALEIQDQHGVVETNVISARPLSNSAVREVKKMIQQITAIDKVVLNEAIDESILGGLTARTPELEVDLSVRSKLNQLKV